MSYNELKEKYKKKIKLLDQRMEELNNLPFSKEVKEEMNEIMIKTNRYLRAIGADESETYDL